MEDLVTFEIAKKLKEKGFREECLYHYIGEDLVYNIESPIANNQLWFCHNKFDNIWHRDNYDAPTISQVLKWLREEKGWIIVVRLYSTNGWYWFIQDKNGELKSSHLASCDDCFATYEQAALAGIEYALNYLL